MEETAKKQIYELGYHVLPTLSEDEVAKVVGDIKDLLSGAEAVVIAEQFPQMMNLAYEIGKDLENKNRKFGSAYFGWIKFEIPTMAIESFKETMDKNLSILRFIIIKTVRESTLATPKLAHKGMVRRTSADTDVLAPMDEAAVDKKIDAMLEEDAAVPAADGALPEVK
jgi:ribosomal protein S6